MNLPGKGCVAADFLHEEKQMSETDTVKMNSIFFISDIYKWKIEKKDVLQEDVPFIKLYQESLFNYLALGVPAAFLTMTFRLSLLNTPHL